MEVVVKTIEFTIPGQPVPWQRPGKGLHGHRYTQPQSRQYQETIRAAARNAGVREPTEEPVWLALAFYRASAQRCDLDNLVKQVKDALNGIAWDDDSQVHALTASKHVDPKRPRCEVAIMRPVAEP